MAVVAPGQQLILHFVPLVDACDTEWRLKNDFTCQYMGVPLVDACDTEWRRFSVNAIQ